MLCLAKVHYYILNWSVRVAVTALLTFWFDKQSLVFRNVAWPALTNDH